MKPETKIRVAIVGSGLAGLCTAYLLNHDPEQRYEITLFEEGTKLSLDAASISLPNPSTSGQDRIDLPMRAFAGGYYKHLRSLYDHLGMRYREQPFLFAFSRACSAAPAGLKEQRQPYSPYFTHASNNHILPPLRPEGLSLYHYVVETIYLAAIYTYFTLCILLVAPRTELSRSSISTSNNLSSCETLQEYLLRVRIPQYFTTHYILPLLSSVATCPHETLLNFPACDIINYKWDTQGQQHFRLDDGVEGVQGELVADIQDVRLSAHVVLVEPGVNGGVKVQWRHTEDTHSLSTTSEEFDRVVLAFTPDVVGKIFEPLRDPMKKIPTTRVESVVHTDESTIPSELDIRRTPSESQPIFLHTSLDDGVTESVHIQPSGVIVTTCPITPIRPEALIQRSSFTRVLRTPESRRTVNEIFSLGPEELNYDEKYRRGWRNGDDNVWLVGGWCWDGLVLLEGCVSSAFRTAEIFGVQPAEVFALRLDDDEI